MGLRERQRRAAATPLPGAAQQPCDVKGRGGQGLTAIVADRAEVTRLPASRCRLDLRSRAGDEVPPHEQPLAERLAAEQ